MPRTKRTQTTVGSEIYKQAKFDDMIGVKVYRTKKKAYRKHNLNLSEIARKAWETALRRAEGRTAR